MSAYGGCHRSGASGCINPFAFRQIKKESACWGKTMQVMSLRDLNTVESVKELGTKRHEVKTVQLKICKLSSQQPHHYHGYRPEGRGHCPNGKNSVPLFQKDLSFRFEKGKCRYFIPIRNETLSQTHTHQYYERCGKKIKSQMDIVYLFEY